MPAEKQRGFCALRYRSGKMICTECETGKTAAKEDAQDVRSGLPPVKLKGVGRWELDKTGKKEDEMADKKKCSCGCGKGAVKDGLAYKCYGKKFGKKPFESHPEKKDKPKKEPKAGRQAGRQVPSSGKRSASGQNGGAGVTNEQHESVAVLETLVAIGAVTADQVETTRKYVREMFVPEG